MVWIDEQFDLKEMIIGFREVQGEHCGENLTCGLNRHSLLPETMEASIRLRSWFKAGIDVDQTVI
jgi:hypothetical protein